ncbi:uncharacterized protein LOC117640979 isoform X2 [Thrips palmi]|uniref:Uncharacterized protein LOC117640979 isoform X2 n=1 Tax=Thrips palmi TaxID=161013 RepID=A0A6P8YJ34_THRPL|nr:uncharacterized protein LOC117640979 isoform X2 [Thrips palmi]
MKFGLVSVIPQTSGVEMATPLADSPARDCCTNTHSPVDQEQKRLRLLNLLRKEIAAVRTTIDSYNKGISPSLNQQMPYVAQLLSGSDSAMRITVRGTAQGLEATRELTINLNQANASTQAVDKNHEEMMGWAQLVHYLLHSRGRLTKTKPVIQFHRPDNSIRLSEPFESIGEKAEYLADCTELRTFKGLRSLHCGYDPDWALRVLQVVAPHIEDLHITDPGPAHLQVLATMPRLRRLQIWSASAAIVCDDFGPFRWPDQDNPLESKFTYDLKDPTKAWQFEDVPRSHVGIVWLKIWLPRHIALPLIAQHRRTLRELSLEVDLPPDRPISELCDPNWAWGSNDLPERLGELVERYQFDALRLVELYRISKHGRSYQKCQVQLQAVRKAIAKSLGTRVVVICNRCG